MAVVWGKDKRTNIKRAASVLGLASVNMARK